MPAETKQIHEDETFDGDHNIGETRELHFKKRIDIVVIPKIDRKKNLLETFPF